MLRKLISISTVAAFMLLAALPLYGMLLPDADQAVESENRASAQFPADATLLEMPAAFEAYFNDHFAFRSEMVELYNGYEYMLRDGGDRVAYGRDGWLFYMMENSRQDIQRTNPYTVEQMEMVAAAQQQAADELAEMGAAYYLMFCPDKHTVYPEYLPDDLQVGEGDSHLDTLVKALARTDVAVVDTREALIAAKSEHQVYLKTDTHWNGYGAFAGYDALARRLEAEVPGFRRLRAGDCNFVVAETRRGGDLAGLVGRANEMAEEWVSVAPRESAVVRLKELPFEEPSADPNRRSAIYENPSCPDAPTCVLFRSSFSDAFLPLLCEGFSRTAVVWSEGVVESVVRAERPDVVIMEYVERLGGMAINGILRDEA